MELVQIDRGDKTFDGYFTVVRGTVIVAYHDSTKSTQVGGSPLLTIAQRLLGELVDADLSTRVISRKPPTG